MRSASTWAAPTERRRLFFVPRAGHAVPDDRRDPPADLARGHLANELLEGQFDEAGIP